MQGSVMKKLSEKMRAQVLKKVGKRPKTAALVAEKAELSTTATLKHLQALAKSGAVVQEKAGKAYTFRLNAPAGQAVTP